MTSQFRFCVCEENSMDLIWVAIVIIVAIIGLKLFLDNRSKKAIAAREKVKPKVTVKTGETKRKPRKSKPEVVQLDLPVVEKPPRTTKKRTPAVVSVPVKTIKETTKK